MRPASYDTANIPHSASRTPAQSPLQMLMENIDQHLLNYDDLSAPARAAVDAYLDAHPEAATTLAEGRAMRRLLEDAARAGAAVPDAESLARYLASQYAAGNPMTYRQTWSRSAGGSRRRWRSTRS